MNGKIPERIFICGFMGAGKTTIGRELAKQFDRSFHDLDACIETQAGQSIPEIFETEGETGFRRREKSALLNIIRTKEGVLALGGGALHNQHLLDHVKVNGLLVFLQASFNEMLKRLTQNKNRPLLLNENGAIKSEAILREELAELYKKRIPYYEQAEVTVQTENYASVDEVVKALTKKIKYHVALH